MPDVLFVCLGNICRSPMAEGLLRKRLRDAGRPGRVASAGTGGWHAGEGADPRTVDVLRRVGADYPHQARQIQAGDFQAFDWILALDRNNLRDLQSIAPIDARAQLALVLDPLGGGDVPDPWSGGPRDFQRVHDLIHDALDAWMPRWHPTA